VSLGRSDGGFSLRGEEPEIVSESGGPFDEALRAAVLR
jgi:hypothetical protein